MTVDYGEQHDFENDLDYQTELVKLSIAGMLADRMEALGLSRSVLAERLNVSPARVTQLLAGYENLTIKTLVGAAMVLDATVCFELMSSPAQTGATPVNVSEWTPSATTKKPAVEPSVPNPWPEAA